MENTDVEVQLEQARRSLLDMSLRNRLLNFREARSATIRIVDELPDDVYRILVREGKQMSFLPAKDETIPFEVDETFVLSEGQPEERHLDKKLQTAHTDSNLQKRLLRTSSNARTIIEEQGINVLYLALGFLVWYEAQSSSQELRSPLILIPVEITREHANAPFKIQYTGEEISTNLSLKEKLRLDFGIALPDIPDGNNTEDLEPEKYLHRVQSAIKGDARWTISSEMHVGLFSFGKLMMYLDLDSKRWPKEKTVASNPIVCEILSSYTRERTPGIPEDTNVDEHHNLEDCFNVIDADSSQMLAILEANSGKNMVIEGPPGTGKSQTISNLVAEALVRNKTVLFVSEKMAALEVVWRRLTNIGLGDACLELHSHKVKKTAVLAEIGRTLNQTKPKDLDRHILELERLRTELNDFSKSMCVPIGKTGVSPYRALGELEKIRCEGIQAVNIHLPEPLNWGSEKHAQMRELAHSLSLQLGKIGEPRIHPWRGVNLTHILPSEKDNVLNTIQETARYLTDLVGQVDLAEDFLSGSDVNSIADVRALINVLNILTSAPSGDRAAFADTVWLERTDELLEICRQGVAYSTVVSALLLQIEPESLFVEINAFAPIIREIGEKKGRLFNSEYRQAIHEFKTHVRDESIKGYKERIELLSRWEYTQKLHGWLISKDSICRKAFGSLWKGPNSDWTSISEVAKWLAGIVGNIRTGKWPKGALEVFAGREEAEIREKAVNIEKSMAAFLKSIDTCISLLNLEQEEAFSGSLEQAPLTIITDYLASAFAAPEEIDDWMKYRNTREVCLESGLTELVDICNKGISADLALPSFEWSFYESILEAALSANPSLGRFDGLDQERRVETFNSLDRRFIEANRQYIAARHWERVKARVEQEFKS